MCVCVCESDGVGVVLLMRLSVLVTHLSVHFIRSILFVSMRVCVVCVCACESDGVCSIQGG